MLKRGDKFGPYEIVETIGKGGMGVVYLALDAAGERVALKILREVSAGKEELAQRFAREGRIALEVDHPNVVRALAADSVAGSAFLASEYVDGVNLAQIVTTQGRLGENAVLLVMRDVAAALGALQAHGTIHRDLKPQNVLVDLTGRAKLLDFGLARPLSGSSLHTRTGAFLGTPLYVSPEQILGDTSVIDIRCDLYALGVVAFFCLTGQPPFRGRTQFSILQQHLDAPVPDIERLVPDVRTEVADLVRLLLQKDPDRRPATPADFLDEIKPLLPAATERFVAERLGRIVADTRRRVDDVAADRAALDAGRDAKARRPAADDVSMLLVPQAGDGDGRPTDGLRHARLHARGAGRDIRLEVHGGSHLRLPSSRPQAGVPGGAGEPSARGVEVVIEDEAVWVAGRGGLDGQALGDGRQLISRKGTLSLADGRRCRVRVTRPLTGEALEIDGHGRVPSQSPCVLLQTRGGHEDMVHALVPGRYALPGGAEIVFADEALWLRRKRGNAVELLRDGMTFRSGALEVSVQAPSSS